MRNPRAMFLLDLILLLHQWKAEGDKILLLGDFNKNIYTGHIAMVLSGNKLRMSEMC